MEKTIKIFSQLLGLCLLLLIALPACGQQKAKDLKSSVTSETVTTERSQLNTPTVQEEKQTMQKMTAEEIADYKKQNPRKRQAQDNSIIKKDSNDEVLVSKEVRKKNLETNISGLKEKLEAATNEDKRKLIKKILDEASKKLEEGNY